MSFPEDLTPENLSKRFEKREKLRLEDLDKQKKEFKEELVRLSNDPKCYKLVAGAIHIDFDMNKYQSIRYNYDDWIAEFVKEKGFKESYITETHGDGAYVVITLKW